MIKEFTITGMSCESCVTKVSDALKNLDKIDDIEVQLNFPQALITYSEPFDLREANLALKKVGEYEISEEEIKKDLFPLPEIKPTNDLHKNSINTYKPLFIIVGFIAGISLLTQYPFNHFSGMLWMRHFMAFFL